MKNLFLTLSLFLFPLLTFAENPYLDGATAASKGQVIRVQKPSAVGPEDRVDANELIRRVQVLKATAEAEKKAAAEEAEKKTAGSESESTAWIDPPAKKIDNVFGKQSLGSAQSSLKLMECRNSKAAFADQSKECQNLMNLEALGLRRGEELDAADKNANAAEAKPNRRDQFCANAYPDDKASFDGCVSGKGSGADYSAIMGKVLGSRAKSKKATCLEKFGKDADAYASCVGGNAVVNGRQAGAKRSPAGEAKASAGASVSMDDDSL